ncbi:formate/nitrite transporter family protein [Archangium lipolyticum]|uniref:formate/nitrite transporter family protein n=1 Tax=Archangium lipolyticum TaxID=2970465 RepID=UPI00214A872D|nr:formate/nitrite transporter family protein [Archangium lipolyticum]
MSTTGWDVEPGRELRHLRAIHPSHEELRELSRSLALHQSLLHQLQAPDFAPGAVEFPRQFLIRFNIPVSGEDGDLRWERLDVVLADDAVLTVEPFPLELVERARARFLRRERPGGIDRFLAILVEEVVDGFGTRWGSIREELQGLETQGLRASAGALGAVGKAHTEMAELLRGLQAARECLEQLTRGRSRRIGDVAIAELLASLDRLKGLTETVVQVREHLAGLSEQAAATSVEVSAESPEVIETAIALGERRLHRMTVAHAITAFIGGLAVSFGGVAMAWTAGPWTHVLDQSQAHLLGSIAFPIGFIILIVGKGELFTENFFVPVTGVMSGRGRLRDLFLLWGSTLAFNLVGAVVFAFLISRPGVLADGARHFLVELVKEKVFVPLPVAFMKAVFAGWLMTMLTWLLLAARGQGARMLIIWMMGFLISAGHFNHVVISAAEVFMAMGVGAPVSVGEWARLNFLPALLGNLVGGIIFVTLLGYVQAHSLRRSEQRARGAVRRRETHH